MPDIEIRSFDTMVNDTLRRIINSTKISNIRPGSVTRTLAEAILAEVDIQYYQISRVFNNMDIDTATGEDLERLIKILGVVRKSATKCTTTLVFGRSAASTSDILIPSGSVVSTRADNDGNTIEFVVDDDYVLEAGELEVTVPCTAKDAGIIYVPSNTVVVMNKPIMNIEYVNNPDNIYGGSDAESDSELRERARDVFSALGKGTVNAIETAVMSIDGVQDVVCLDCARGVGTADLIVVTATIPPSAALVASIEDVIADTKAAGIDVQIIYPTVLNIDISVNLLNDAADIDTIGNAILGYIRSLGVGDSFIINQMERAILNVCTNPQADIRTMMPISNISTSATQIIGAGTITINGVVWDG